MPLLPPNAALLERFRLLAAAMFKRGGGPFMPPADPYAAVPEPRRRNPGGRSSAIALDEPPADIRTTAIGATEARRLRSDPDDDPASTIRSAAIEG